MTIAQFRADFPEFNDTARYPDSLITFWLGVATLQVNACVWKAMTSKAIELYTAHEIVLAAQNQITAQNGGAPGTQGGLVNSKTLGQATVSYDTITASEKNGGYWNRTIYGQQFYRLSRIFGAGCIQL